MVRRSYGGLPRELYEKAIANDPVAMAELEKEADELDDEGETILHRESYFGSTKIVGFIVDQFAHKNILFKLDRFGETALHIAVRDNKFEMVKELIDAARRNLPPPASDDSNNPASPFHGFIRHVSGQKGRNTALHLAVSNGNADIVMLLVDADPSYRHTPNDDGETPIYIAVQNGFKYTIKMILRTRTTQSLDGPDGRTTVLHVLIDNIRQATEETTDTIRMIFDAAKRWSNAEDPPHVSFETLFNRTDESGRTLLELAMEKNYVNVVQLVLQEDLAYQRGSKKNDLMRLIYKAIDKEYSQDIVKLLSQIYEAGISDDHKGVVKLILAIKSRDKECVLRLLEDAKQLVSFADDEGWTPLHYAAYHGVNSVLAVIVDVQTDVGYQFEYGDRVSTPLIVAAERGHTSTMIRLMQLWPKTSSAYTAVNKNGRNILHIAAAGNKKEMIQGILNYCPKEFKDKILKQKDNNDDTLLHLLISHGCYFPELILHEEFDVMAKNKKDWIPWDMLYLEGDIIADQVHIKMALDDVQAKKDSLESRVPPYKRERKDVILNERINLLRGEERAKKEIEKQKYLDIYKNRTNTQIIVTALITTVTFTVGFTIPGGLHQSGEVDEGLVVLSRKAAFKAFMLSDALGLLFSTSSLLFYFLESINKDIDQVRILSAASTGLNIVSIMVMMVTFITGTYVVLSNSPGLAISVCGISSLFFLLIIFLSRNIYKTVMFNIRTTPTRGVKKDVNTMWHDVAGQPC